MRGQLSGDIELVGLHIDPFFAVYSEGVSLRVLHFGRYRDERAVGAFVDIDIHGSRQAVDIFHGRAVVEVDGKSASAFYRDGIYAAYGRAGELCADKYDYVV